MYLRFISPWPTDMRNVDLGIFQAAHRCREERLLPDYLMDVLTSDLSWFDNNLPVPRSQSFKYRERAAGICWFRDDAKTMIRRARRMASIMMEGDVWITESLTWNPGRILYEDDFQIISLPHRGSPTAWGQTN